MIRMKFGKYVFNDDFFCFCDSRPLPEFRPMSTNVDGTDGESFDELTLGPRKFTITLVAKAKTFNRLQRVARRLATALLVREPTPFVFTDENDDTGFQLSRLAVPTGGIDVEEFMRVGRWTVEFVQYDPYLYGKKQEVVLKANVSTRVKVNGNAPTYPVLTARPTGTSYWIKDNLGHRVDFKGPFVQAGFSSSQSQLRMNFLRQTAYLSPSVSDAEGLQLGSEFWAFEGRFNLRASHDTTLSWHERWL